MSRQGVEVSKIFLDFTKDLKDQVSITSNVYTRECKTCS